MNIEIIRCGRFNKWLVLLVLCYLCILMTVLNYNIIPINVSLRKVHEDH